MIKLIIFSIIILATNTLHAQYKKAFSEGRRLKKKGDYYNAILYYNSTNVCSDKLDFFF